MGRCNNRMVLVANEGFLAWGAEVQFPELGSFDTIVLGALGNIVVTKESEQ